MTRTTKSNKGLENQVMTRKTRKMASADIADVEDDSIIEQNEDVDNQKVGGTSNKGVPRKTRKSSKRKSVEDPLTEINGRYEKELIAIFKENTTDRIFDGFTVDSKMSFSTTPGVLIICANLRKSGHVITRVMRPVISYPYDIRAVAVDLYSAMECWGTDYARHIGV